MTEHHIDVDEETTNAGSYDSELTDFINESRKANTGYKINMFRKIANYKNAKFKFEFMENYTDEIPDYKEIGIEFGPGEYQLNIAYTGKKGTRQYTSRTVLISDRYAKKETLQQIQQIKQPQQIQQTPELLQLLQSQNTMLFQTVIGMLDKMLSTTSKQENPNMEKMQASLNNIILNSAKQQQDLINTMANRNMQQLMPPEETEETADDTEIFTLLKWLWENFGEKLLKGGKGFKAMAKKQVQGSEQLKQILSNPQAYAAAYDRLIEEAPPEQVNKLLSAIGVPTPDELLNTVPLQAQG